MKISQLVKTICQEAENKFGVSGHLNDAIYVSVYYSVLDNDWQVWLSRASKRELASGEVEDMNTTTKMEECAWGVQTNPTLLWALTELLAVVEDAEPEDWIHE